MLDDSYIAIFRTGNKEVFRLVYDELKKPLLFYMINTFKFEYNICEDLVAESFYKIFINREKYRTFEHVKRSIYVILRNLGVDQLRAYTRAREADDLISYLEEESSRDVSENEKTTFILKVLEALENLPPQRRKIIKLYFFYEKDTHEIAEIMKLSPQTVLNHKTKALEQLKRKFLKVPPEIFT